MRTAFINALDELAAGDPSVCLVVGDLGFSVVDEFARKYPRQFVNPGVAEQNMTGIAAGMALSGKVVFTYSIANFTTLRCLEQIRNDLCYHRANVTVVSVGGGLAYGSLGATHHATEDLAIMRALPGMVVLAPGDPVEAAYLTRAAAAHQGPCYLRLGKAGERRVHTDDPHLEIGRAYELRSGTDLTLISTGGMLATAVDVADSLSQRGLSVRVLSMHTVSPLDDEAVVAAAEETRLLFTLEEHSARGGLGGAVAEVLAGLDSPHAPLHRIGLPPVFAAQAGSHDYLRHSYGLDAEGVLATMEPLISRSFRVVG